MSPAAGASWCKSVSTLLFKAKVGIPDLLPIVMSGKLTAFLVFQSRHLGPSWGFIDASVLSMSEQSQGFGASVLKGSFSGILPSVALE